MLTILTPKYSHMTILLKNPQRFFSLLQMFTEQTSAISTFSSYVVLLFVYIFEKSQQSLFVIAYLSLSYFLTVTERQNVLFKIYKSQNRRTNICIFITYYANIHSFFSLLTLLLLFCGYSMSFVHKMFYSWGQKFWLLG